ncbi:hypothetical protein O988_00292 [Pseudogymnoascus sp. VKM F-3808]|nr:hypothetical protein O988_00292 [Pseudogymnoascus sp. VKM F-3808]
MAAYLTIPILEELVRVAEDDPTDEAVKAMASGILSYYFPPANGYLVVLEHIQNNLCEDIIIFRIKRRFPSDKTTFDHTFSEVRRLVDATQSLDQLENALDQSSAEFGRCWAMIIQEVTFKFYEYHTSLPAGSRLVPWGPPNQEPLRNSFHIRNDSVIVDWMLRHMVEFNSSQAR